MGHTATKLHVNPTLIDRVHDRRLFGLYPSDKVTLNRRDEPSSRMHWDGYIRACICPSCNGGEPWHRRQAIDVQTKGRAERIGACDSHVQLVGNTCAAPWVLFLWSVR